MKLPPKAKTNVRDGFKSLTDLAPGTVVHFCMVRVGGEEDENVRVVFGGRSAAATKDTFFRAWSDDEAVKESSRPKWFVVRGAITMRDDKVTTVPAIRGNRVLAPAELKSELKALRASMTDSGLPTAPLKRAIDGKIVRAEDTTKLVSRDAGPAGEGEAEEEEDEADLKAGKGAKDADVKALVARYKKIGLKAALTKMAGAADARGKAAASKALSDVRDGLIDALEEAAKLDKALRAKTLGATRFKDSLTTLKELSTRGMAALHSAETALGNTVGGAGLTPESRKAKDDPILDNLRKLVSAMNAAAEDKKTTALADLYFAADTWLKLAGEGSTKRVRSGDVDLTMKPKVLEVFGKAARQLSERAGVTINNLPSWLERRYAKGMEAHGFEVDVEHQSAKWMTPDQRETFRIHVKGGMLYQYNWWEWPDGEVWNAEGRTDLATKKMVPVNSASSENEKVLQAGYSGFVMSMGGDLYMARHDSAAQRSKAGIFHSSYMAGTPVLLAGEILVKNGVVKRVNTSSGHYRPSGPMIVRFLKQMATLGVKVEEVADFANKNVMTPDEFLRANDGREPNEEEFRANELETAKFMHGRFKKEMFDSEQAILKAATTHLDELSKANKELEANVRAQSEGNDKAQAVAKRDAQKKVFAKRQAERLLAKDKDDLADLMKALLKRQEDRASANAALRSKDGTAREAEGDVYTVALASLIVDARGVADKVRLALVE